METATQPSLDRRLPAASSLFPLLSPPSMGCAILALRLCWHRATPQGVFPIMATPFNPDETLDLGGFTTALRFMADAGAAISTHCPFPPSASVLGPLRPCLGFLRTPCAAVCATDAAA